MWGEYGMGWGWGVFGALHMFLWCVVIILGIVLLVKWLIGGGVLTGHHGEARAPQILKERYARGEIGKEEFEQKKHDLSR